MSPPRPGLPFVGDGLGAAGLGADGLGAGFGADGLGAEGLAAAGGDGRCANALAAAVFDAAPVLPSRSTFEAAVAAFAEVDSAELRTWVSVLPAAVLDASPVFDDARTLAAAVAAFDPVVLLVAMCHPP